MEVSGKRQDIQVLRGLAVALVVLHHAELGPFAHGYLGVDIFFVISGFLITGIIVREMNEGRFSLAEFYLRRARRILPAALVTVAVTALAATWLVDAPVLADLRAQVLGALTFTSNLVLWGQTGYFDLEAAGKPLLHMWSLAVEEQFYLLFPALLLAAPRRFRLTFVLVTGIVSLAACIWFVSFDKSFAFYMLPTRAWELFIGSAGALAIGRVPRTLLRILAAPAIVVLLAIPVWSTGWPHPGVDAALVCLATLAIILADLRPERGTAVLAPLARLGDLSYSLYLVHWPVFVLVAAAHVGPLPLHLRIFSLVVCLALAVLLHVTVERPFLSATIRPAQFAGNVAVVSMMVAVVPFLPIGPANASDFQEIRRPNVGYDRSCDKPDFIPRDVCRTTGAVDVLIWGDSYAMHLVPGMAPHAARVGQATMSACPPLLRFAAFRTDVSDPHGWAGRCIKFNQDVLDYATSSATIKTVVLAGSFASWARGRIQPLEADGNGVLTERESGPDVLLAGLQATVGQLQAAGKRVVVVSPTPAIGGDKVSCAERRLSGRPVLGDERDCTITEEAHLSFAAPITAALDRLQATHAVALVDPARAICFEGSCHPIIDGKLVYRDAGHLTYEGSKIVMNRLEIAAILQ